jgi:hypothetical protein
MILVAALSFAATWATLQKAVTIDSAERKNKKQRIIGRCRIFR